MKRKGFTLIEIVSSLLIFAAGGTMALSVFNYNAGNRVEIMERMEAFDLASGILNTLVLRSQTDEGWKLGNTKMPTGNNVWTGYEDVPIQSLQPDTADDHIKRNSISLNGAANFLKSGFNAFTELSGYQYRYRLIKADSTNPVMKIKRSKILYRTYDNPTAEEVALEDLQCVLQVEVSWPRDELTESRRKKVLLNTVVTCP